MLEGNEVPEEAAGALLVLIPKEERPETIKQFMQISLSNICTKLVTKVIANHLKGVLKDIVFC